VIAPLAQMCEALAERTAGNSGRDAPAPVRPDRLPAPEPGSPMRPGHVFDALAARLPADAVVLEESPSSRRELQDRLPARAPLGFVSAAMGGLGFAIPAAVGIRMALSQRAVVAIVGDGSSLYSPQALWSAAQYDVGALFIILRNGGYAIMDRLAEQQGEPGPWPSLTSIDIVDLARSLGCDAMRVSDHGDLEQMLEEIVPSLPSRTSPLLLEVDVER
jgi:benzoylformate decarboxylase